MELFQQLHEDFKIHLESDNRNFAEIKADLKEIKEGLKPLTEAYDGILFSKKFLLGVAGAVLAIGAIGGGFIWLINTITNRS